MFQQSLAELKRFCLNLSLSFIVFGPGVGVIIPPTICPRRRITADSAPSSPSLLREQNVSEEKSEGRLKPRVQNPSSKLRQLVAD